MQVWKARQFLQGENAAHIHGSISLGYVSRLGSNLLREHGRERFAAVDEAETLQGHGGIREHLRAQSKLVFTVHAHAHT